MNICYFNHFGSNPHHQLFKIDHLGLILNHLQALGREQEHPRLCRQGKEHFEQGSVGEDYDL